MSKTTYSFFIGECSRIGSVAALPDQAGGRELSPRIITTIAAANESLERATARLLPLAEIAYGQRDYASLQELSNALTSIPFAQARNAGRYYQALIIKRQGNLDRAADLLTAINAPRAIHTLGTIEECRGNWTDAARLHVEAMRAGLGVDPFTVVSAGLQLAAIRSFDGDHTGSLHAFQSLWPVVRIAARQHPHFYPLWCNALAIELAELGRVDEARQTVAVAIASPVAERYPEWQETADELRQVERPCIVTIKPQVKPQAKIIIPLAVYLWSLVIGCYLSVPSAARSMRRGRAFLSA